MGEPHIQDLLKARSEVRLLEARKHEADHKMKQADLNVEGLRHQGAVQRSHRRAVS